MRTMVSSSSSSKTYDVEVLANGRNTCTCVNFVMKRNKLGGLKAIGLSETYCKHIKKVMREQGYVEVKGPSPADPLDGYCLACSKVLTSPTDRRKGYGPECASRLVTEAMWTLVLDGAVLLVIPIPTAEKATEIETVGGIVASYAEALDLYSMFHGGTAEREWSTEVRIRNLYIVTG